MKGETGRRAGRRTARPGARRLRHQGAGRARGRAGPGALAQLGDRLRDKLGSGVIVIGAVSDERPAILALVTPDLVARGLKAGAILGATAQALGGRGGGRPERAQGGGGDPAQLDAALAGVPATVAQQLAAK